MKKTNYIRSLFMAAMIGTWGCGGGGGPGVSPTDDAGGPTDALDGAEVAEGEAASPPCGSDSDCDDNNPCTKDTCKADGCHHEPLVTGSCDDGDPCTQGEACQDGVCVGGEFVCECKGDEDCGAASDDCHVKTCDLETHSCVEGPRKDGTPCDDANPCTEGEACWDGACQGGKDVCPCEKDEECPAPEDPCSPLKCRLSDHTCQAEPLTDGSACEDGDLCTLQDQCDKGKCKPGAAKDCDDHDGCTKDSCDPKTGECGHEFVPQFGCCQSDGECDDQDPCTVESCVKHQCQREGEAEGKTGTGCATVSGCAAGFCSVENGECRSLTVEMPAVLFDWDLTKSVMPRGMRWTTEAGTLGPEGAGPRPGEGVASFVFPAHFVPAGVQVLLLTMPAGTDCGVQSRVQVKVGGQDPVGANGCAVEEGRAVLGFVYQTEAASRLDLEVLVQAGAVVSRATLYLHAVRSCKPLGPVVAVPGAGVTDVSVAALRTGIGVGHRFVLEKVQFGTYSLWNAVKQMTTPAQKMMAQARHRTSLLSLLGDRFLFAYDGSPGEGQPSTIEVALLDGAGEVQGAARVPEAAAASSYEPFLVKTPSGEALLVYSTSGADPQGLGVRFVKVQVSQNGVGFGVPVTVNSAIGGDQMLPVLGWSGEGGIALWKSYESGVSPPSSLRMRKVSASGPEGLEYKVLESSEVYQSLAVLPVGDYYFVAATTSDGALKGFRVLSDLKSAPLPWYGLPEGEFADVTLLPGPTNGAVLVGTYLQSGVARVVQAPVSPAGAMGEVVAISGPVNNATATPTLGSFGPFLRVLAFTDTLSSAKGVRMTLLSSRCSEGPVSCKDNIAKVCTGLGGTGYSTVSWTDAWCH